TEECVAASPETPQGQRFRPVRLGLVRGHPGGRLGEALGGGGAGGVIRYGRPPPRACPRRRPPYAGAESRRRRPAWREARYPEILAQEKNRPRRVDARPAAPGKGRGGGGGAGAPR